jgi:hypothetical protein
MRVKRLLRATAPRLNALTYDDSAASSARRLGPPGRSASRDDNSAVSFADDDAAWPFRGVKVHTTATAAEMMSARWDIAVSIVYRLTRISWNRYVAFADVPRGILLRYDAQIEKNGKKSEVREERSARA